MNATVDPPYARGAIYGLAAVCIWASFIVVFRLGVRLADRHGPRRAGEPWPERSGGTEWPGFFAA